MDVQLTQHLTDLQAVGIAPSTRRTYRAAFRHFTQFCSIYDITPLPASETTLCYFCAYASRSLSHPSILLYLAAVRYHHLEQGYADPLTDSPLLSYLCKGIKRHQGITGRQRLPLTAELLSKLQPVLRLSDSITTHDKPAVWAALTLGFHAFLRAAEFTAPTTHRYSPSHHLLRRDVAVRSNYLTIKIKGSKTDPYRASCTMPVAATHTNICPVRAMRNFLSHAHHSPSLPLFTLRSGHFLTRERLTCVLRDLLEATGLPPDQAKLYGSHSLRIGAATAAASAGLPTWLIQAAGRWKSAAFKRYIRSPTKALMTVAPALADQGEH